MTIKEVQELVELTKECTQQEMRNVASNLSIFDCCNYVLWMQKLHKIKISI